MRRALRCCWGGAGQPGGADSPRSLASYKAITKWHRAASAGDAARVRKLLVRGKADVNAADRHDRTALHFACAYGHPKVVTLLLRRGCEVDAVDSDCNTALMKATQCQQEDCVCILLEHGANPNRRDACGKTALQHAVSMGNIRIAAKLVAFGAYVDNIRKDILLEISNAAKEDEQRMSDTSLKNEENEGEVDDMENKCRGQEESNKEETTASHENVPEEEHTNKLHVKTQLDTDMTPPDMELNGSKVNLSEDETLAITTPEKECEHQKTETTLKNEENEGEVDDMENKCRGQEESNKEETTASHENVPEEEHTNKLHVKTQLDTDMTPPDMELNGSKVNLSEDETLAITTPEKECEHQKTETTLKNEENEGEVDDMENKCRGQEESNKEETTASHENVPEEEHTNKLHVKTQLDTDMTPPDMELNGSKVNLSEDETLAITTPEKECEHQKTETTLKNEENEGEVDDMEKTYRGQEESNKEETTASHENVPEEEHTNKLHVKTQLEADMTPHDMELNVSKINVSEDENVHIQSSKCEQLAKEMGVLTEELQLMRSACESQTEEIAKLTHKLYRAKLQTKQYKEISKVSAASENLHIGRCQQLEEENKFLKEQLQSLQSKKDSLAEENTKLKEDQRHLTESCKCTIDMTEQYRIFLTQKSESEISEQVEKVSNFIQEQNRARAYQDSVWTSTVQAQLSKISQLSNKLQECERKIKRLEDENCKLHLRVHLCQTSSETFTTRNSLNNPTERNSQSFLGPRMHFSAREDYADLSPRLRSAFEKVDAFLREL